MVDNFYRSVRRCFFTSTKTHLTSFSDDRTVKVWDIAAEAEVHSFNAHDVSSSNMIPQYCQDQQRCCMTMKIRLKKSNRCIKFALILKILFIISGLCPRRRSVSCVSHRFCVWWLWQENKNVWYKNQLWSDLLCWPWISCGVFDLPSVRWNSHIRRYEEVRHF